MGDYNFLLGAQPIEAPNPLGLAGQALTLGNLATNMQANQMKLQGQQQYAAIIPQLVASGFSPEAIQAAAQQGPLGLMQAMQERKTQELTSAQIAEAQGKATQSQADAYKNNMAIVSNMAYGIQQQPGPLTPAQKNTFASVLAHTAQANGQNPADLGMPSVMADDNTWRSFTSPFASAETTPEQATNILVKTTGELPKLKAETQKTMTENALAPYIANSQRISANASALEAGTKQQQFQYGAVSPGPAGTGVRVAPRLGPQGQVLGAQSENVAGVSGQPAPQLALGQGQEKLMSGFAAEIAKQAPTVQKSLDMMQQIIRLKTLDDQGIYAGPLGASQYWKDITGVVAPFMAPDDRAKVENSQAFNADANSLVGTYMNQIMGGRMSRGALAFGAASKPSDAMQPGARALLWRDMYNAGQRNADYWNQAADYAAVPQNAVRGPGGFKAQFKPDTDVPTLQDWQRPPGTTQVPVKAAPGASPPGKSSLRYEQDGTYTYVPAGQ